MCAGLGVCQQNEVVASGLTYNSNAESISVILWVKLQFLGGALPLRCKRGRQDDATAGRQAQNAAILTRNARIRCT